MTGNEYSGSPLSMPDQSGMLNPYASAWLRDRLALACDGLLRQCAHKRESA